jgi:transcriptional regulator with XRE-family HTH domain
MPSEKKLQAVEVTYAEVLGQVIDDYRQSLGLSQVQFAIRCELPQPTISRVMRGKVDPQLSTLLAIAQGGCGVSLRNLLQKADKRWDDL